MSLFSPIFRAGALALALTAGTALTACTLTPVYSNNSATEAMRLHFAAPNNPLEQLVYQDLGTKFGMADNPNAPQVSVTVSNYSRGLGSSVTTDPAKNMLMTVTGVVRITRGGASVLTATRQATASYSADSQVIADKSAESAAADQAAHALAETLELTIMATLAPQTAGQ